MQLLYAVETAFVNKGSVSGFLPLITPVSAGGEDAGLTGLQVASFYAIIGAGKNE